MHDEHQRKYGYAQGFNSEVIGQSVYIAPDQNFTWPDPSLLEHWPSKEAPQGLYSSGGVTAGQHNDQARTLITNDLEAPQNSANLSIGPYTSLHPFPQDAQAAVQTNFEYQSPPVLLPQQGPTALHDNLGLQRPPMMLAPQPNTFPDIGAAWYYPMQPPVRQRTPCSLCFETFARQSDLQRHWQSVHLGIKYHCYWPGCLNNRGKGYCRVEKLRTHQREKHGFA